jgi:hypothetical protein
MLAALALAAQLVAADIPVEQAKALADGYESALTPRDNTALVEAQGKALGAAVAACGPVIGVPMPFYVVVHANSLGNTDKTWRSDDSPLARCIERHLASVPLPSPTGKPFHASYELTFGP